ncbi:MAG TPA: Rieske (2Fe-2S) protein [Solirubrobacterales bacterium]|jgi:3-phenylpropionate/trans-cinnamate dioxygenase ferredoxin subunit|nr:Rieske (2Fe-2S) protein [Solirubrobacterales bacterium]
MRERLGEVSDFRDGEITVREVGGRSVGVFRDGESFYGMLNICPHRGAPVCEGVVTGTMLPSPPGEYVYGLDGLVVRCPWHGWEFDLRSGESIGPVDKRKLTMLPVEVEGDAVYLAPRRRI